MRRVQALGKPKADEQEARPSEPGSWENAKAFLPFDLVVAGAGVVAVPPIWAAGINGLLIQPATTTIAISIAVIGRPPANPGYEDPIVEVIVEAVVDEVIVIEVIVIMCPAAFRFTNLRSASSYSSLNSPASK